MGLCVHDRLEDTIGDFCFQLFYMCVNLMVKIVMIML